MLISYESLVGWNPRLWEAAADTNLELFGKETTILVTVRDPIEYITSIYQQVVQEGRVISPEEFFRHSLSGGIAKTGFTPPTLDYFDIGAFSYQRLAHLYQDRFERVHFLPVSELASMRWLETLFGVNKAVQDELATIFQASRRLNQSYSQFAMNLTFGREMLLKSVGLGSKSAHDRTEAFWIEYYSNELAKATNGEKEEMLAFARRKIRKALRWRRLMQEVVPRIFPNHKYAMPTEFVEQLPNQKENFEFLRQITIIARQN